MQACTEGAGACWDACLDLTVLIDMGSHDCEASRLTNQGACKTLSRQFMAPKALSNSSCPEFAFCRRAVSTAAPITCFPTFMLCKVLKYSV